MAEAVSGIVASFKGDSTLSAYRVVTGAATATAGQVKYWATQTSNILGVTLEDSKETNASVPVVLSGIVKVVCKLSVGAWDVVGPATDGSGAIVSRTMPTTVTAILPKILGLALENGSTNSVIKVALQISNKTYTL